MNDHWMFDIWCSVVYVMQRFDIINGDLNMFKVIDKQRRWISCLFIPLVTPGLVGNLITGGGSISEILLTGSLNQIVWISYGCICILHTMFIMYGLIYELRSYLMIIWRELHLNSILSWQRGNIWSDWIMIGLKCGKFTRIILFGFRLCNYRNDSYRWL